MPNIYTISSNEPRNFQQNVKKKARMKTYNATCNKKAQMGITESAPSYSKREIFPPQVQKTKNFTNQKKPADSLQHVILQQSMPYPPTDHDFLGKFNKKLFTSLEQTHVEWIPNPQRSNLRNPKDVGYFLVFNTQPTFVFSPPEENVRRVSYRNSGKVDRFFLETRSGLRKTGKKIYNQSPKSKP